MRYSCVTFLLLFPAIAAADSSYAVRPTDPLAHGTLARALERSAVVRLLVAELQASNLIVHINTSRILPMGIGGMTRFVTSRGGYRYVRVTIASNLRDDLRVLMLGHELQHAREIAQSPATDVSGLFQLFEAQGYRNGPSFYETKAALEVERKIRRELEAEPVVELHHQHLRAAGAKAAAEVAKR